MQMTTNQHVQDAPLTDRPGGAALRTLVAIDGSEASNSALRVAGELAAAARITPTLLSVWEVPPLPIRAPIARARAEVNARLGSEGENEGLRTVLTQAAGVLAASAEWPVHLARGYAAEAIDGSCLVERADLLIMGLHRHDWLDRTIKLETTLEVIGRNHASVLGVVPHLEHMPRCIVVGTDFSQASHRAAKMAARLLASGGKLVLVYADAMFDYAAEDREGFGVVHDEGVRAGFAKVRSGLDLPIGATVEARNIDSTVTRALLEVADHEVADLIAIGRQHHSKASRALLGSTATDLVREARVSVLVTPIVPWTPQSSP